jgi:hypothetical protein
MAAELVERGGARGDHGQPRRERADKVGPAGESWARRHLIRPWRRSAVYPLHELASPDAADALVDRAVRSASRDYANALIRIETVDLSRVHPLTLVLDPERQARVATYLRLLDRRGLQPYVPAAVRFRDENTYQLALPPVVEDHEGSFCVVDGTHRLKLLVDRGDQSAVCVVVQGSHLPPLPSEPGTWNELRLASQYVSRSKKFRQLRSKFFRPTGAYLRSHIFEFDSLSAISEASEAAESGRDLAITEHWCQKHQRLDNC